MTGTNPKTFFKNLKTYLLNESSVTQKVPKSTVKKQNHQWLPGAELQEKQGKMGNGTREHSRVMRIFYILIKEPDSQVFIFIKKHRLVHFIFVYFCI